MKQMQIENLNIDATRVLEKFNLTPLQYKQAMQIVLVTPTLTNILEKINGKLEVRYHNVHPTERAAISSWSWEDKKINFFIDGILHDAKNNPELAPFLCIEALVKGAVRFAYANERPQCIDYQDEDTFARAYSDYTYRVYQIYRNELNNFYENTSALKLFESTKIAIPTKEFLKQWQVDHYGEAMFKPTDEFFKANQVKCFENNTISHVDEWKAEYKQWIEKGNKPHPAKKITESQTGTSVIEEKKTTLADLKKQLSQASTIQRTNIDVQGNTSDLKKRFEQQPVQEPRVRTPKTPVFKKPIVEQKPLVQENKPVVRQPKPSQQTTQSKPANKIAIENKGLFDVSADIYVNAASIKPMEIMNWGGVAGAVRSRYAGSDYDNEQALMNSWNGIGKYVREGTAVFVNDKNGQPYGFNVNNKIEYLIHAGSPMWNPSNTEQVIKDLTAAYAGIFENIANYSRLAKERGQVMNSVAIPPLGIGIYGIPAEISAECAYNAFKSYLDSNPNPIQIIVPLFGGENKNSADYAFGQKLQALMAGQKSNLIQKSKPVQEPVQQSPQVIKPVEKPVQQQPQVVKLVKKPIQQQPQVVKPVEKPVQQPPQIKPVEQPVQQPVQQQQKVNYENKSTSEILGSILSGEIEGEEEVHNAVFAALEKTRNINKNEVSKILNLAMKNKPNPNYDAKQKIEDETNKFFKAKAGKK